MVAKLLKQRRRHSAHADLQRIPRGESPAYKGAVKLHTFLAERRVQISAGIRYRLCEPQVRAEIDAKNFDRVHANLDYHGIGAVNQESELYWVLRATAFAAMGEGHYAKAQRAARHAIKLAQMRERSNAAAEEILRRVKMHGGDPIRRVMSWFTNILSWFTNLFGAAR